MKIQYIFFYLSMFFWIFPAVKQYKTEMFWYFLVFALTDPIKIIVGSQNNFVFNHIYSFSNFLLMLSVLWSLKKKGSIGVLLVMFPLLLASLFLGIIFRAYLDITFHLIITYSFIKRTFMFIAKDGKLNIFHLFLLLEEISIILKMVALLISIKTGIIFLVSTGVFEILIAIFFTLYREDNTKLHIDLRNA